jgi:hypothetical protein
VSAKPDKSDKGGPSVKNAKTDKGKGNGGSGKGGGKGGGKGKGKH